MDKKKLLFLKRLFFGLMLAVNVFIIYQSCLPESSSKAWSDTVVEVINVVTGGDIDSQTKITPTLSWGKLIRKVVGHLSLYG